MTTVPGAASELLRPLFDDGSRALRLVVASSQAVHLATDHPLVPLLSVVPSNGVRLPGGVLSGELDGAGPRWSTLRSAAKRPASIGAGVLRLGQLTIRPVRWWVGAQARSTGAVRPAALRSIRSVVDGRARPLDAVTGAAVARLEAAIRGGADAPVVEAVQAMVGAGPGLTPSGDDVLVGALLALHHWEASQLRGALAAGTAHAAARTTAVSAALLAHAARGEGMPVLLELLDLLHHSPSQGAARAVGAAARVAAVGHDTGSALLRGVLLATRHAATPGMLVQ